MFNLRYIPVDNYECLGPDEEPKEVRNDGEIPFNPTTNPIWNKMKESEELSHPRD